MNWLTKSLVSPPRLVESTLEQSHFSHSAVSLLWFCDHNRTRSLARIRAASHSIEVVTAPRSRF